MALTPDQARRVYNRIGRLQDRQSFYEDPAIDALLAASSFDEARSVVELGCGTGRVAARLLAHHFSSEARYLGLEVSPTMARLARDRLAGWADRAVIQVVDGSWPLPAEQATADRFVATYVLDLLSHADAAASVREARRVLRPGGRLCVAGLTFGATLPARVVERAWRAVWRRWPTAVGGCRPVAASSLLDPADWVLEHQEVVTAWALSSEVLVAVRRRDVRRRS